LLITLKADLIAPTAPTIVASAVSTSAISLTLAAASTDIGGLKEYVLERSTTVGGTYAEIARGLSIFPYSDSGLSSATAYFYRAKAIDNSLNEGNYSSITSVSTDSLPSVTGTIRTPFGHYKWIDTGSGGGGQVGELAQIAALNGKSYMAGAVWRFDWDDVEGAQGVYTFTKTDAYVNQATAVGKKIWLGVRTQYFSNSVIGPAGRFPSYLSTAGTGGAAAYVAWDGVNPSSPPGSLALCFKFWDPVAMVRYNAVCSALAVRYKDNVTVAGFMFGETSIASLPGSGYTLGTYITGVKNWGLTQRAAWPNTEIRIQTNYISGDNAGKSAMKDLMAFMDVNQLCGGGPDNFSRTYDSNPVYTGFNGGIDYRNRFSWVSESQYPASSSGGPGAGDTDATTSPVPSSANIYAHNESGAVSAGGSTKPHYYFWFNNTYTGNPPSSGTYHTYPAETEPFIASINGASNTFNSYAERFFKFISTTGSDAAAGDYFTPWAITALATKTAIYKTQKIGLLSGTYRFAATPGISIPSTASGTGASHTIIKSVVPRGAILTNNTNGAGAYVQNSETTWCVGVDGSYIDLVNLTVTDCSGHGIVLVTVDNILIEGCKITDLRRTRNTAGAADTNHGGVFCKTQTIPKTNVTVKNCEIGDIYSQNLTIVGNNSNAIGDLFGAVGWIIELNTVYRCGTLAYWKGQTGNHKIRNNFVYDVAVFVQGYAIEELSSSPTYNKIYNNVALVNAMGGPQSGNTHNGATLTEVYNNTIILKPIAGQSDTGFGSWTCAGGGSPSAVQLYNNLIFVDPAMAGGYQELYSHASQIAPKLRYTTNGGLRNYNTYSVFRVTDTIGGTSFDGAGGLTAIRLPSGWGTDAATEIRANFGFSGTGNVVTAYTLTGSGVPLLSGRVGGVSGGAAITRGAWDGVVTQIGKDW
jgi:hypothetical protein